MRPTVIIRAHTHTFMRCLHPKPCFLTHCRPLDLTGGDSIRSLLQQGQCAASTHHKLGIITLFITLPAPPESPLPPSAYVSVP